MITIVAAVLGLAAGCGSTPASPPSTGTPSGAPPSDASPASPADTSRAEPTAAPPSGSPGGPAIGAPAPPPSTGAGPPPPPGPGELPGGLPHGERTLTGVVDRSGDCTLLRVGSRWWQLTGTAAGGLVDGSRVTAVGQVTNGAGCGGRDVTTTLIVQRVTPA
ncbi:hypothetical protein [Catenuloplanes atrovinosus]|uniref:DUF5666 domain-containing protein n=1 Tax=Catenuloplanes atrovinosus TaxID=137266 RepID=A0AAE4CED7_9ACTN|nr:hypothetical protein [Catenuloplanes atrovinosus]MDR7278520.1 hypothetical protein [Catenuloplanes atrovinosus]